MKTNDIINHDSFVIQQFIIIKERGYYPVCKQHCTYTNIFLNMKSDHKNVVVNSITICGLLIENSRGTKLDVSRILI